MVASTPAGLPLPTNGPKNDIPVCQVTKRKGFSGGTRKRNIAAIAADTFLSLVKTCQQIGVSFWDYLGDRLNISGAQPVHTLPKIVANAAKSLSKTIRPQRHKTLAGHVARSFCLLLR